MPHSAAPGGVGGWLEGEGRGGVVPRGGKGAVRPRAAGRRAEREGANAEISPVRGRAVSIYGAVALGWYAGGGGSAPGAGESAAMLHVHAPFPAVPPGASPPGLGRDPYRGGAAGLAPPAAALGPRAASAPLLDGYREAYRRLASGLAGGRHGRALYPPGHPFYSRAESAEALRAENEKLRREIADLRAQRGSGEEAGGGGSSGENWNLGAAAERPFRTDRV